MFIGKILWEFQLEHDDVGCNLTPVWFSIAEPMHWNKPSQQQLTAVALSVVLLYSFNVKAHDYDELNVLGWKFEIVMTAAW